MTIELIYDAGCPNVDPARRRLADALADAGLPPRWQEWDRAQPGMPARARRYGSPTILVDGRDVSGTREIDGAGACRLYDDGVGGLSGLPSAADLAAALAPYARGTRASSKQDPAATAGDGKSTLISTWAIAPAIGLAMLPKLTCAACWPAYTAVLSSFGVGFVDYTPWLMPLTVVMLAVTLATLAWRAKTRRGHAPLLLGVLASAAVLHSRFVDASDAVLYGGLVVLLAASVWNAWPQRRASCSACETHPPLRGRHGIDGA